MKQKRILVSTFAMVGILAGGFSSSAVALAAEVDSASTVGDVTFVENNDPVSPVDPEDPDKPITPDETNPGTNDGPLRIVHVSNFHFGNQKVTSKAANYHAALEKAKDENGADETYANSVQISDERGTNVGWKVQVKQENQFKSVTSNKELTGAQIVLKNTIMDKGASNVAALATPTAGDITLVPDNTTTKDIAVAAVDKGMGIQVARFGTKGSTAEESVELQVPANTAVVKEKYATDLTWILNDSPA